MDSWLALTQNIRKCLKWVVGKKNALGDKPATRRAGAAAAPLTWTRLPFATRPMFTTADMAAQRETVRGCLTDLQINTHASYSFTLVLGDLE